MGDDQSLTALSAADALTFMQAVMSVMKQIQTNENAHELFVAGLEAVFASSLDKSEQNRRAVILVRKAPTSFLAEKRLLQLLAGLPPSIKTSIAGTLPPESLSVLYRNTTPNEDQATLALVVDTPRLSTQSSTHEERPTRNAVVVLLSVLDNQEANISLLHNDGFQAYSCKTVEDLNIQLSSLDICGFVVDGSFWSDKTADEQEHILQLVSQYSSLATLVIDRSSFHSSSRVQEVVVAQHLRQPSWSQMIIRDSSLLSSGDLSCFQLGAELIDINTRPSLIPNDFTDAEVISIVAASSAFFREDCYRPGEGLNTIGFSQVRGGRSSAKLLLLHFNNEGMPVIAKVWERQLILDEVDRFRTYISRFDNHLKPFFHFHQNLGVIIFGLVEDATQSCKPAPTLEEKIERAWSDEIWQGSNEATSAGIQSVIVRSVAKLAALNKQQCDNPKHESYAYMRGSALRDLSARGTSWEFPDIKPSHIAECIDKAHTLLSPLSNKAVVHGDIHLRNILARDTGDAYLIDYAFSGPGHPAFDLVRLECCLYFQYLRPLGSETSFASLQKAISIDLADEKTLRHDYAVWWSSAINRVLLQGAILCRNKCLDVLMHYGADVNDYIAAKFTLCCRSIAIPNLQMGLIRATIGALAPSISAL